MFRGHVTSMHLGKLSLPVVISRNFSQVCAVYTQTMPIVFVSPFCVTWKEGRKEGRKEGSCCCVRSLCSLFSFIQFNRFP